MHLYILIPIYLLTCYLLALSGKKRKFGFWGYLFLSIFMTPLIGLLTVLASDNQDNLIKIKE